MPGGKEISRLLQIGMKLLPRLSHRAISSLGNIGRKLNLWEAPKAVKFSWLKTPSDLEPHSLESTSNLKELLSKEAHYQPSEAIGITSLPEGKEVIGFSPGVGISDHLTVFSPEAIESPIFKTEVAPQITVPGSKLKRFTIGADISSCLSQKLPGSGESALVHMSFLRLSKKLPSEAECVLDNLKTLGT
ncbi:hypothetical protein [Legionella micdadei]|uniref:hypothetical protein n=1 Tax=Legionella micdadei TaxID=451 RepID=UPI0009EF7044|nr:hypothetical protein [Legionella micdadei]ARG99854.1 hypothetical protein B6V88_05180 [Legionella micdadei]